MIRCIIRALLYLFFGSLTNLFFPIFFCHVFFANLFPSCLCFSAVQCPCRTGFSLFVSNSRILRVFGCVLISKFFYEYLSIIQELILTGNMSCPPSPNHIIVAEPLKPTTTHTIDPSDVEGPSFLLDDQPTFNIRSLTISTEATFGELHSKFIDFLAHLHALEVIVIHWQALDWFQLGEASLRAFVRLFSLPSLTELRVSASGNFPLCLLKYFTGKKLFISANTISTSVVLLDATSIRGRERGLLKDFSVCGTRNMQEFRTYAEWQTENARKCLQSTKCLRCHTSWRDPSTKHEEVMRVLGTFLFRVVSLIDTLEEFHFSDLQPSMFTTLWPSSRT